VEIGLHFTDQLVKRNTHGWNVATGLGLATSHGKKDAGTPIVQAAVESSTDMWLRLDHGNGYISLINVATRMALDVKNSSLDHNAPMIVAPARFTESQIFRIDV